MRNPWFGLPFEQMISRKVEAFVFGVEAAVRVQVLVGHDAALLHEGSDVTLLGLEELARDVGCSHRNFLGRIRFRR